MVSPKKSKLRSVLVNIDEAQVLFLKKRGVNRSSFMRQAIDAYKVGIFKYDSLK